MPGAEIAVRNREMVEEGEEQDGWGTPVRPSRKRVVQFRRPGRRVSNIDVDAEVLS